MIDELNREEFFKTFNEFFGKLHKLVKVSDDELVRKFYNNDCVNIHNLLDKTDDQRRFFGEMKKIRLGWDSLPTEIFMLEEATSVNIVLSKLERMVR